MQNVLTQMKTKKANKGFTMVELIIVIAIIAVLAAVLAPQYLRFVEESKVSTDKQTAATVEAGINVLIADGTINLPTITGSATSATSNVTWNTTTGAIAGSATVSTATGTTLTSQMFAQLNVKSADALIATSGVATSIAAGSGVATANTITWTITHYDTGNITITSDVDYKAWG